MKLRIARKLAKCGALPTGWSWLLSDRWRLLTMERAARRLYRCERSQARARMRYARAFFAVDRAVVVMPAYAYNITMTVGFKDPA